MDTLKIGALAAATGCQVETVRYYERAGLMPLPHRSAGNYRLYGSRHIERMAFIRHCRSLDMSLAEVRRLLECKDELGKNCGQVDAVLDEHILKIRERIAALQVLESQLTTLRAQCDRTRDARDCKILQGLMSCPAP